MSYPHGSDVLRDRREPIADPYNPARTTVGSWDDFDALPEPEEGDERTITLEGVYIAASSTSAVPDAVRTHSSDYQSLYSTDRLVDVQIGDRIRHEGHAYFVDQRPQGDINPFTGWAPGVEIPLRGEIG